MLSCLVKFDNETKFTKFESPVHKVLPLLIKNILFNCRRDSGYRLCCRTAMHSTDPKCFPKNLSSIKVMSIALKNEKHMAFDWGCSTLASMKKGVLYKTRVCITLDGHLLCCKCTCKASGRKDVKCSRNEVETTECGDDPTNMACAHISPAIMKFTLMLCDYLAQDLCYELGVKLTKTVHYKSHSNEEMRSIKDSLVILGNVALVSQQSDDFIDSKNKSVIKILKKHFNAGTEKQKSAFSYKGLCPLENVPLTKLPKVSTFKTTEKCRV